MVQGERNQALAWIAEPQPMFSEKKYTSDRAQINAPEFLDPPITQTNNENTISRILDK